MQAENGSNKLARRVVVTVVVLVLAALARRVQAPGLELQDVPSLPGQVNLVGLSIAVLGLTPWVVGWFLVEVFSLLPGPGRRLRRGGWEGRQTLDRASMVLGLAACLIQAMGAAQLMESYIFPGTIVQVVHPGWWFRIPYVLTLTATSCALYWLGTAVNRWGIGHGFSLLLLLDLAFQIVRTLTRGAHGAPLPLQQEPNQILAQGLAGLAFAALFFYYLYWTDTGWAGKKEGEGDEVEGEEGVDEPDEKKPVVEGPRWAVAFPQSVFPVVATGWLLPILLGGQGWKGILRFLPFGAKVAEQGVWFWIASQAVLVVGFAWLFFRLFSGPGRLAAELPLGAEERSRREAELVQRFWLSTGLLLAGSAGLVAWSMYHPGPWATIIDVLRLSLLVPVGWDLASQWRFTVAHGSWATLCSLNNVHLAPEVVARLANEGIPSTLRGFRHRAFFFAYLPLVQIGVLVPEGRLEEAQKLLEAMDLKVV